MRVSLFFIAILLTSSAVKQSGESRDLRQQVTDHLAPFIMESVTWAMKQQPQTVTAYPAPRSAGGMHDFYSEGDYWWPDPQHPDSPYIQRDGVSNPDNFIAHRFSMIRLNNIMGSLGAAYLLKKDPIYVKHALLHSKAWFIDSATAMSPHLLYAQAIKGRHTGRGIGIIDAIHLMEVVQTLRIMENSPAMDQEVLSGIKKWFTSFSQWLTEHPYGIAEMNAKNNHGTCWVMQVAAYARFTGNTELISFCRDRYKTVLLPDQMAANGSFPLELKRTKPYSYSIFNLDAMATICQILSDKQENLWNYQVTGDKSIEKGIRFLFPFVADKSNWPYQKDVMYWDDWPVAPAFLVFGGVNKGEQTWLNTWKRLDHQYRTPEVIRNMPVKNPTIWME